MGMAISRQARGREEGIDQDGGRRQPRQAQSVERSTRTEIGLSLAFYSPSKFRSG